MNKQVINVPQGIRYISEWNGFRLNDFPHILDKKIPGCGFTEWAITNNEDLVLCSPRKILLQNKYDQHKGEVFLVVNEYEKVIDSGRDLASKKPSMPKDQVFDEEAKKEYFKKLTHDLLTYIKDRHYWKKPVKILVTYDSFKLIYDILHFDLSMQNYRVVVDEFQSIFTDSRFKPDTELIFMSYLKKLKRVCFVSATPMMESYLDKLEDFKWLQYFELDWEALQPGRTIKPKLKILQSKSVFPSAKKIIDPYKTGQFEKSWKKVGDSIVEVESREAVIYVNSVNNILSIIKQADLKYDEVNILCANTEENRKKIRRKLGKEFSIGKVPLRNEPRKMFTFCTRTVYLGADFYSDNARSFIISDANIETLAVDISLDLPQILGRQRLEENPWKNEATFYYKPLAGNKKLTKDDFDKRIAWKLKLTNDVLISYQNTPVENRDGLVGKCNSSVKLENYKDDYVAVDKIYNPNTMEYNLVPVQNNLVLIAEERAYDIQQVDYADRFTVFNSINSIVAGDQLNKEIENFMQTYESLPRLYDKLKYLCEYNPISTDFRRIIMNHISEKHLKEYYEILGPERCKALGYNITKLNKDLGVISFDQITLTDLISKEFSIGDRLTRTTIKERLSIIYSSCGYEKAPKATDLEKWFEINEILMTENGKRIKGFKIIKKK